MQSSKTDSLARVISDVLIPPLFLIVVVTILLTTISGSVLDKILWWIILVIGPAFLPVAFIVWLFKRGKVKGLHLPLRQERTGPYLFALFCIAATILLLGLFDAPGILVAMMLAYFGNAIFLLIINFFWKVSAHAVGVACPLMVLSWEIGAWALPLFILIPVVAWARVQLRAHTIGQVLVGSAAGLVLTYFQLVYVLPMFE